MEAQDILEAWLMIAIIITPFGRHIDRVIELKIKDANCVTESCSKKAIHMERVQSSQNCIPKWLHTI